MTIHVTPIPVTNIPHDNTTGQTVDDHHDETHAEDHPVTGTDTLATGAFNSLLELFT
jgi:hypothetical protein